MPRLSILLLTGCGLVGDRRSAPAASSVGLEPTAVSPPSTASAKPLALAGPAVGEGPSLAIAPLGGSRQGSTLVLGTLEDHAIALAADTDARAIHVIDRGERRVRSSYALLAEPAQMVLTRTGQLLVALRGGSEVLVLMGRANGQLGLEARFSTAAEPFGLALTPDGASVLVTSVWGRKLEAFTLSSRERSFSLDLPRDPRSVLVTDDGTLAFVSHAVGSVVSRIGLPTGAQLTAIGSSGSSTIPTYNGNTAYLDAVQGFGLAQLGPRVLIPQALMNTGLRLAKPIGCGEAGPGGEGSSRSPGAPIFYGESCFETYPIALQSVAVIDAARPGTKAVEKAEPASVELPGSEDGSHIHRFNACVLPRAAVVDEAQRSLLVACLGRDLVLELDATAKDPARHELRRFAVPAGPSGLAFDAAQRELLVFSQHQRSLVGFPLGPAQPAVGKKPRPHNRLVKEPGAARESIAVVQPSSRIDLPAEGALAESLALGRRLFHAQNDVRIASDERTCASCHPDGSDDGLTWATPAGPRQTPALAGRSIANTGPYGWSGADGSLDDHLDKTFRRLRGKGLAEPERAALRTYVQSLPGPARTPVDSTLVARGRLLFETTAGCTPCHGSPLTTDNLPHDIGSGGAFETPSLALVAGTAPYFHDGRYPTLRALLLAPDGKMGNASALPPADLDALEAFLGSL